MAVAAAQSLIVVRAPLRGREEPALRLDRSRAEQHVPVILSRHERERGRDREDLGAAIGERPVELGEPHVEADRKAELADRGVGHDDVGARGGAITLEETHAAVDVDVEEMELPVGREPFPLRTEEHGRVVCAALVAGLQEPDASLPETTPFVSVRARFEQERVRLQVAVTGFFERVATERSITDDERRWMLQGMSM